MEHPTRIDLEITLQTGTLVPPQFFPSLGDQTHLGRDMGSGLEGGSSSVNARNFFKLPEWMNKANFFAGLKNVGLGIGCVACGLIALGLLPTTLIGVSLVLGGRSLSKLKNEGGWNWMIRGMLLAAPLTGVIFLLNELGIRSPKDWLFMEKKRPQAPKEQGLFQ